MGNVCGQPDDKPEEEEEKVALAQDIKKVAKKVDVQTILSVIRWNRDDGGIALIESDPAAVVAAKDPQNGNCAIHVAAQNGHRHVAAALIKAGADINARTVIVASLPSPDPFPRAPRAFELALAAKRGRARDTHMRGGFLPSNDGFLSHPPCQRGLKRARKPPTHCLPVAGSRVYMCTLVVVAGSCRKDADLALAPITTRTCTFDSPSPSRRQYV